MEQQQIVIKKMYSRNEATSGVINSFFREHMGINAPLNMSGYNAVFNVRLSMNIRTEYNSSFVENGFLAPPELSGYYRIIVERIVNGINYPIYNERFDPVIQKVLGSQRMIKSLMREALHENVETYYFDYETGMATTAYFRAYAFEDGVMSTLSLMGAFN